MFRAITISPAPSGQLRERRELPGTALRELVQWSGHPSRLDCDLKPGSAQTPNAAEQHIGGFGFASLYAHLDVNGQLRHAEYIGSSRQPLRDDDRAAFTAASTAGQTADYLLLLSAHLEKTA